MGELNLLYLDSPDQDWGKFELCGEGFPCTGRLNVLFKFLGNTQQESPLIELPNSEFVIISNNPTIVDSSSSCKLQEAWNAYICDTTDWALLEFESLDSDRLDRSVQPIIIKSGDVANSFENTLNSFMDHGRQGFYAS